MQVLDDLAPQLTTAGFAVSHIAPLPGDVSPRRYARVQLANPTATGGTAIAALYSADIRASGERFLVTSRLLAAAGIRVPRVLASDLEAGWTLLEDLGSATVYELTDPAAQRIAMSAAVALLPRLQAIDLTRVSALNPPLDEALLRRELAQTEALVFAPLGLPSTLRDDCAHVLDLLCRALAQLPPRPCHRDLMARNLVPLSGGEVGVLDHQDLRLGPPVYDLASLLNDSWFATAEDEAAWLAAALPDGCSSLDYSRAVVQRTLKACGTFAAFARRGSRRHLPLVAPAWARACRHLALLSEGGDLAAPLQAAWQAAGPDPTLLLH